MEDIVKCIEIIACTRARVQTYVRKAVDTNNFNNNLTAK